MSNRNYSIRQLIQIQACTNCQACADVCPAVAGSFDGKLSAAYRLEVLGRLVKARTGFWRRLGFVKEPTAEELRAFSDTVFRCTLCGNCRQACPAGLDLTHLWHSLRRDLVASEAYPGKIDMIRENLDESHNVFGEDNEERAEWVEDMPDAPEHGYVKERAEVIYFTGCVSSFFPLAQRIPMALAKIFDAARVDFTLLGEDEWCCGFPLLGAGLGGQLDGLIANNVEAIKARGAKQVVFACPSCYRMWQEHYPQEFELFHATEFLGRLLKEDRLPLRELDLTLTYHDPCDLGRGAGTFDAPRDIIKSIPGIRFVELSNHRENCSCCGGGGNLEMIDASLSANIAGNKMKEVQATGAQAVVTACQQCVRTMTTYAKRNKVPVEVMDIVQLINKALAGED
ncbi:MAG: (Fe-S)-binding protein [Desulfobacterales bacterium]|nr:(Fe-S)-binding protein [Desulfobacterales bacterium]